MGMCAYNYVYPCPKTYTYAYMSQEHVYVSTAPFHLASVSYGATQILLLFMPVYIYIHIPMFLHVPINTSICIYLCTSYIHIDIHPYVHLYIPASTSTSTYLIYVLQILLMSKSTSSQHVLLNTYAAIHTPIHRCVTPLYYVCELSRYLLRG